MSDYGPQNLKMEVTMIDKSATLKKRRQPISDEWTLIRFSNRFWWISACTGFETCKEAKIRKIMTMEMINRFNAERAKISEWLLKCLLKVVFKICMDYRNIDEFVTKLLFDFLDHAQGTVHYRNKTWVDC